MNNLKKILLISFVFFVIAPQAHARRFYAESRSRNTISASEAKQMAEDRFGGKALSATFEDGGPAGSVYRVKVIKGGRVKVVTIPANP